MALFKRGLIYWYDFWFQKARHQGSTGLKNREKAKMYEAKLRTDLALGAVGLTVKKRPPVLSDFLQGVFLDSVRQNAKTPRTRENYENEIKRLCEYVPFTLLRLDEIGELAQQDYKEFRRKQNLSPWTINGALRVLRKAMIFADVCGLARYQRLKLLPGEIGRSFVLDTHLEALYLSIAPWPLRETSILMLDLGIRPEEALRLKPTDVTDEAVTVMAGKTENARRALPQTERTREVIALCRALFPESPWLFPGKNPDRHYTRKALDNAHKRLARKYDLPREFVLYSCRHTFGTRLAQSGANPFEIKLAMGHSSVRVSERYIHPNAHSLSLAMKRKEQWDRMLRGETVPTIFTTEESNPTENR